MAVSEPGWYPGAVAAGPTESNSTAAAELPARLVELFGRVKDAGVHRHLVDLARSADLGREPEIDPLVVAEMVGPYQWMLDRVGPNGLPMTPSNWMKPGDVFDCITETGMEHDWYGQLTRENMTPPVLLLRESMQRVGLVQKLCRQLAWTAAGERLRGDPVGLWNYLAAKTSLGQKATQDAGRIVLLLVANGLEPAVERFLRS